MKLAIDGAHVTLKFIFFVDGALFHQKNSNKNRYLWNANKELEKFSLIFDIK